MSRIRNFEEFSTVNEGWITDIFKKIGMSFSKLSDKAKEMADEAIEKKGDEFAAILAKIEPGKYSKLHLRAIEIANNPEEIKNMPKVQSEIENAVEDFKEEDEVSESFWKPSKVSKLSSDLVDKVIHITNMIVGLGWSIGTFISMFSEPLMELGFLGYDLGKWTGPAWSTLIVLPFIIINIIARLTPTEISEYRYSRSSQTYSP